MDETDPYGLDIVYEFEAAGSNQSGVRDHNERLVLTILRRQGPLPKAEIARRTGLSAQTVSVIMRALEKDGLITKGEKLRGKIGQPSVPMQLAPDGAYFLGLKVGRRFAELILVNFVGEELAHVTKNYNYPTPSKIMRFTKAAVDKIHKSLPSLDRTRIAGMGIASPYFLWEWGNIIGVGEEDMAAWKDFDLRSELQKSYEFPVFLGNDATSACGAELTFGKANTTPDFLYIYIGYFVGGGVVLNGKLYPGKAGNAGAIGPFPILDQQGQPTQLVDKASMIGLERRLSEKLGHFSEEMLSADEWSESTRSAIETWLDEAIPSLAQLILGACSIIDFSSILIDGNMPSRLRTLIIERVKIALQEMPMSGLIAPTVEQGSLGVRARPLGAASLPLSKKFMLEA